MKPFYLIRAIDRDNSYHCFKAYPCSLSTVIDNVLSASYKVVDVSKIYSNSRVYMFDSGIILCGDQIISNGVIFPNCVKIS